MKKEIEADINIKMVTLCRRAGELLKEADHGHSLHECLKSAGNLFKENDEQCRKHFVISLTESVRKVKISFDRPENYFVFPLFRIYSS